MSWTVTGTDASWYPDESEAGEARFWAHHWQEVARYLWEGGHQKRTKAAYERARVAYDSYVEKLRQARARAKVEEPWWLDLLQWAAEKYCEYDSDLDDDYDPEVCSPHHSGRCWPCEARLRLARDHDKK